MYQPLSPAADVRAIILRGLLLAAVLGWLAGLGARVRDWTATAEDTGPIHRPNILLIVADDLGYNDISAINPRGLSTPNIDRLAQEGATFRRHYADATCTPSRVAILSGRYPERSGFRPVGAEIPDEYPTLAERLRDTGYRTYLTGKWHAGEERRNGWPDNKGFEQWFGFLSQFELGEERAKSTSGVPRPTYFNPLLRHNSGAPVRHPGHLTDILTTHTLEKIRQLQQGEEPWFVYHAFLAPHTPIQPAPRYKNRFPATPEGAYTALVTQLDDAVGRLLEAVDTENTLVIFVSDNGGTNRQRDNNYPFHGRKNETYEGAYRTPLIMRWTGRLPERKMIDDIVMNVDIYPTVLAAARAGDVGNIDGANLWPLLNNDVPLEPRDRGWEAYSSNVNTLSFSYLSADGHWRLASLDGLAPELFNLGDEPAGRHPVTPDHPGQVAALQSEFWRDHWEKSRLPVLRRDGDKQGQTLYEGFDTMRTPFRHGFAIGLELGPLPASAAKDTAGTPRLLAGQGDSWDLRYTGNRGLEWRLGDITLRDASFDPSRCNAVILTGYLQPLGHLAVREPRSTLKLFSGGALRDRAGELTTSELPDTTTLDAPTYVNYGGRAVFSNMLLSSFAEPYAPAVSEKFIDFYESAYRERSLVLADVRMMDAELCRPPTD
ncbi:MAG: sulfatase-like hydrolase/transferase [Halioglobus sp.]|nr:sulfatase-like hydrolase/transferase [Halioglobus sp.]